MNGPQHYSEAERWLDLAKSIPDLPEGLNAFAAAQVHATLALTAATLTTRGYGESDWTEATR